MKKINIAIDGPSGVGKSTISKIISDEYGYTFINSGSIYRAISYYVWENNINLNDDEKITSILSKLDIIPEKNTVILNGVDISNHVRKEVISEVASKLSQKKYIRDYVINYIHNLIKGKSGIVMDGRDTTYRLMPNAELKIFLWAEPNVRADRRLKQNHELGFASEKHEVLNEVLKRDQSDMERSVDPLMKVEDAYEIDCTHMSIREVVEKIISLAKERENE
ncbi:(d)CMP kinase [Mycoplasma phocimorsus]|uniref:Cytidylate kinase n=1 Tax=Mycoplasma phocimorsus TaxID=3045839 RepID=A0AAJ1PTQ6_9MOLU|nr:(d)CMP kinase [Mycoplasma phocimorsus]MDJ1645681.1 (d)CMP kinase [Mycoplasma phocimorsus]MDJ1646502.1 (d)CMP kinase [Mycoplasma phocimorsus]MDJ1646937.1 (d)CMP kinase [Mycoplasma phocimorsus]MDJ1647385.1 (d)CMP kinase [Mycoplasma phocimorsus]MDJ1648363.1 (d)CMP kinase [Mycoplasma phocimorsus]